MPQPCRLHPQAQRSPAICQLFCLCSAEPIEANALLARFFEGSRRNPDGWGFVDLSAARPLAATAVATPLAPAVPAPAVAVATPVAVTDAPVAPTPATPATAAAPPITTPAPVTSTPPAPTPTVQQRVIIKEDTPAAQSPRARQLAATLPPLTNAIAHTRLATKGFIEPANNHPFSLHDTNNREWILAHHGTLFSYPPANPYLYTQQGGTDSERILYLLVDLINQATQQKGTPLEGDERFAVFSQMICDMAPGNKVNLIVHDSRQFFIHTNYRDSLFVRATGESLVFSTVPLTSERWDPVPLCTPLIYRDGTLVQRGPTHSYEYIDREEDTHFLYTDFSGL